MFVQLVYASRMITRQAPTDLVAIVDVARAQNAERGITGMLCFGEGRFLQCLEGPRESVNHTFQRICRDPRHDRVELLCVTEALTRTFSRWTMGWAKIPAGDEMLRKYFRRAAFAPEELSADGARAYLREVSEVFEARAA